MKKVIFFGVAAALVVAGLVFGPELRDGYRLQNHIAATVEAGAAEGGAWPRLTDACVTCHGERGSSLQQSYPSLAGQPASYVSGQLRAFAAGQRDDVHMGPLAMSLSETHIRSLADYYAKQPARENRYFKPDNVLRDKGGQLVDARGCAACHGARMMGQDAFPRLAGQGYDYLVKQLAGFADGTRVDPTGSMAPLAAAMTPEDRTAIAQYLASMAVAAR